MTIESNSGANIPSVEILDLNFVICPNNDLTCTKECHYNIIMMLSLRHAFIFMINGVGSFGLVAEKMWAKAKQKSAHCIQYLQTLSIARKSCSARACTCTAYPHGSSQNCSLSPQTGGDRHPKSKAEFPRSIATTCYVQEQHFSFAWGIPAIGLSEQFSRCHSVRKLSVLGLKFAWVRGEYIYSHRIKSLP